MSQQSTLIPYISSYEEFASGDARWLPYLVFFNRPNYRSPALNTDAGGFRYSHGTAGRFSLQENLPAGPVSILLGASPAFGIGASGDERTVASILSRQAAGIPWLNLSGPALNSTQELVLFMLHRHQLSEVRDVVVFSGLNNLVVTGLPRSAHDYGQFFFSEEFFRLFGFTEEGNPRWALGMLAQAAKKRLTQGGQPTTEPDVPDLAERISIAVRNTARDLDRLQEIAAPTGARVHFVLQPTATWTGKRQTPEEYRIFDEIDRERSQQWSLFGPILDQSVHQAYAQATETACKERGVPFLDLNVALGEPPAVGRWLFVDECHLTDLGYETISDIISDRLELAS